MNPLKSSLIVGALLAASAAAFAQTPPPALERDRAGQRGHGMREIDTNKDSKISREEAASHPHLAQRFDQVDANKDGFVTRDEMRAHAQANHPDQNKDGLVSRDEAAKHPQLAQNFDKIDTNKDNMLSKDELKAARKALGAAGRPKA
jgi:hypothetical protein